ncbi:hypothetical protein KCTCHS21_20180 [Cohnella abietis]|uniref:Uncharacterized protein n=2 Tax=Cohnella abietis TaxID=2507935 RepID=A0A3T1D3N1_9BACL|nr:hypothetical protein KCTCHS21_20180 [Cohnella abietis]
MEVGVRNIRAIGLWKGTNGGRCTIISSNRLVEGANGGRCTIISSNGVVEGRDWSEMYDYFEQQVSGRTRMEVDVRNIRAMSL